MHWHAPQPLLVAVQVCMSPSLGENVATRRFPEIARFILPVILDRVDIIHCFIYILSTTSTLSIGPGESIHSKGVVHWMLEDIGPDPLTPS
jgi:uncharacterized membrane protein YkvI